MLLTDPYNAQRSMPYLKFSRLFSRLFIRLSVTCTLAFAILLGGCSTYPQKGVESQRIYFSHSSPRFNLPQARPDLPSEPNIERNQLDRSTPELVIFFDNNSARVRPSDIERLQSFVIMYPLNQLPLFIITGYTDSNHSDTYNISLSQRRSRGTQTALLGMGVPITQTALRALGESAPNSDNSTEEGRQDNRRVTIRAVY